MDLVAELRPAEAEREDPGAGAANRTGKAIVVLSDGTGNSSAKLARTNVWRLYQAIDGAESRDNVRGGGGNSDAGREVGLRWPSDLAARVELRPSHP